MLTDEQKILMCWARLKSAVYMHGLISGMAKPDPELLAKCRGVVLHEAREWERLQKFARIACLSGVEEATLTAQVEQIKAGGK